MWGKELVDQDVAWQSYFTFVETWKKDHYLGIILAQVWRVTAANSFWWLRSFDPFPILARATDWIKVFSCFGYCNNQTPRFNNLLLQLLSKFLPWGWPDQTAPFSEISHDSLMPTENPEASWHDSGPLPFSMSYLQAVIGSFVYPAPCTLVFASDVCLILT